MKPLQDSNRVSVARPAVLSLRPGKNFKSLETEQAEQHLLSLQGMLRNFVRLQDKNILSQFHAGHDLAKFVDGLATTVQSVYLKLKRDTYNGRDTSLNISIDPTHSGFPLFVRDLHFLNNERNRAPELLQRLPRDEELVEDAIFTLFRGVLPTDIFESKVERDYLQSVAAIPEITPYTFHEPVILDQDDECKICRLCVQRLEEHHNIPRFYSLHFRVPNRSQPNDSLMSQLQSAVEKGFGTTVHSELKHIAKNVEQINGIILDLLQRVDVGPYYSHYTDNEGPIADLLQHAAQGDSLLFFTVHSVQRVSEQRVSGFGGWMKALASGDWHLGNFSQVLVSPVHVIMPHRLIQKAHHLDIRLAANVKMFGVGSQGELIESTK